VPRVDLRPRWASAPRAKQEPGLDTGDICRQELAVETWGPLVFVCPDPSAEGRLMPENEKLIAHFQGLDREALG
jgi:phenylpropionate dioxygenase-like ring-hydroxylating dioxygenase large terminal subunit